MDPLKNHDIRLKHRPQGLPSPDDFELVESSIPTPEQGQILVKNLFMSVDPYMRGPDRRSAFGQRGRQGRDR